MRLLRRTFLFLLLLVAGLGFGCMRDKYVCPAYHSMFWVDSSARAENMALFDEDSTPKDVYNPEYDEHLLIEQMRRKKKEKMMYTVKMETIYPSPPDSAGFETNATDIDSETKGGSGNPDQGNKK